MRKADRRGAAGRVAIALRGKHPTIECENLIQVIFIAGPAVPIIFPQRKSLFTKYFLNTIPRRIETGENLQTVSSVAALFPSELMFYVNYAGEVKVLKSDYLCAYFCYCAVKIFSQRSERAPLSMYGWCGNAVRSNLQAQKTEKCKFLLRAVTGRLVDTMK